MRNKKNNFFFGGVGGGGRAGGGRLVNFFDALKESKPKKNPTQTNVSNGTTTPQGEHLCKIVLKSIHKCRIMARTS